MTFFSVASLVAFCAYVYFGVYVLTLDRKATLNRTFFAACAALSWWALCDVFMHSAPDLAAYSAAYRLSVPGWVLCSPLILHFFVEASRPGWIRAHRWALPLLYGPAAVFVVQGLRAPLSAGEFVRVPLGWYEVPNVGSPWFWALLVYLELYAVAALAVCVRWAWRATDRLERRQARGILFWGALSQIGITLDLLGWPLLPGEPIPSIASLMVLLWLAGVYWAVVKYRLMRLTPGAVAEEILGTMTDAVLLLDREGRILTANRGAGELFGIPETKLVGEPVARLFADEGTTSDAWFRALLEIGQDRNREMTCKGAAETTVPVTVSSSVVRNAEGLVEGAVAVFRDISEMKRTERQLRHMAEHDPLTGLPNRLLFGDRLSMAVERARRYGQKVGVLFIDLDHFKEINDTLGHEVGDALLFTVAQRLLGCIRKSDTVCRMGGDEFAMIFPDVSQAEDFGPVIERIIASLSDTVRISGHPVQVNPSLGVAMFPEHGDTPEQLMKSADVAMYAAKAAGGNTFRLYSEGLGAAADERHALEQRLREALARGHFVLHYQPQVDLASNRVVAVEALIRWQDPEHGLIPPVRFIPHAEESGVIIPIGEWVMREACAQAMRWRAQGLAPVRMAVNLSARQFSQPELVETVGKVLAETGLEPSLLELEITEHTAMHDVDETARTLERLRALGVRIAIDDFGTGYSSLLYLKQFTVDTLKIGQTFIRDVAERTDYAAIVAAIVGLAHSLRLETTIAEGVETTRQLEIVRSVKCQVVQGYLFSKPLPAEKVIEMLPKTGTAAA